MTDITVEQDDDQIVVINDDLETVAISETASIALFSTIGDVAGVKIDASLKMIRTLGFYAPGDGGGADYVRVASEPAPGKFNAGKIQSADGAWWVISETVHNVLMFGAQRDNPSFDNGGPFQECFDASCRRVDISPGDYYFSTTPTLSGFFRDVSGYGAMLKPATTGVTVLKIDGDYNGNYAGQRGWWRSTLRGLQFDHGAKTNCNGLEITGIGLDKTIGNNKYLDLLFWGQFDNALINTEVGDESTQSWCIYANCMVFDATRGIVHLHGSGTGNVFNGGCMTPVEKGLAWLSEDATTVGDISVIGYQIGVCDDAIYLSPNAQYRSNVAIVASQADAGADRFINAVGYRWLNAVGNNYGGGVYDDIGRGHSNKVGYINAAYYSEDGSGPLQFDAARITLEPDSACRVDVDCIGNIGGVGACARSESFLLAWTGGVFTGTSIGVATALGTGFTDISIVNGGDMIGTIRISFTPTAVGTDFEVFYDVKGGRAAVRDQSNLALP